MPIKGPISTDPVYERYPDPVAEPARVKPEAENTAKHGVNGTLGKILLDSYDAARRRNMNNTTKKTYVRMKNKWHSSPLKNHHTISFLIRPIP